MVPLSVRGVARVMNMCTHNARGRSGFSLIHGCHALIPAARSSADTAWGPGGLPRGKLKKKRSQMVASDGTCGKDIDLKF